jgi:hypothetical protein
MQTQGIQYWVAVGSNPATVTNICTKTGLDVAIRFATQRSKAQHVQHHVFNISTGKLEFST